MNNWRVVGFSCIPLNAELNPICHLIALLGGATIVVVSMLRVKQTRYPTHIRNHTTTRANSEPRSPLNGTILSPGPSHLNPAANNLATPQTPDHLAFPTRRQNSDTRNTDL